MKKELWGFLGIFLLVSIGFASAGWFDWITGHSVEGKCSYPGYYLDTDKQEYISSDTISLNIKKADGNTGCVGYVDVYIMTPWNDNIIFMKNVSIEMESRIELNISKLSSIFSSSGFYGILLSDSGAEMIGGVNTNAISFEFTKSEEYFNCIDSDGVDYYASGYVQIEGSRAYDDCKDSNTLIEQICGEEDVGFVDRNYDCSGENKVCCYGACMSQEQCNNFPKYIIGGSFGSIEYSNHNALGRGADADVVDTIVDLFKEYDFIDGESAKYDVPSLTNVRVLVAVSEFEKGDIPFSKIKQISELAGVNYVCEIRSNSEISENGAGICTLKSEGEISKVWISENKVILLLLDTNDQDISLGNRVYTDLENMLKSYLEKYPSTLVVNSEYPSEFICTDTDKGKYYFVQGTTSFNKLGTSSSLISYSDSCNFNERDTSYPVSNCSGDSCFLIEYSCSEDKNLLSAEYSCPNGCQDGACIKGEDDQENSESEAKLILVKSEVITDESRLKDLDFSEYGFVSLNESEYNFLPRNSDKDEVWVYVYKTTKYLKGDFEPILTKGIPSDFSFEDFGTPYFNYYQIYGETIPCDECSLTEFNFSFIYWSSNENSVILYLPDSSVLDNSEKYSEIKDLVEKYKDIYAPSEVPYLSEDEEQTPSACQLGYRKSGSYCNEDGIYVTQKNAESFCDNSFECESNLCIDGECVSSSLWQKIINFFKNIFG